MKTTKTKKMTKKPVKPQAESAAKNAPAALVAVGPAAAGPTGIVPTSEVFKLALGRLSNEIQKVEPGEFKLAQATVKQLAEVAAHLHTFLKGRIVEYVVKVGQVVSEKGAREAVLPGGDVQKIHLHRTGVDPKKLEALLRAKRILLETVMRPVVSYKVDDEKLSGALMGGLLTEEEVATTYYDETWVVG